MARRSGRLLVFVVAVLVLGAVYLATEESIGWVRLVGSAAALLIAGIALVIERRA